MECGEFLAGLNDESLAQYIGDLSTCTNGYEVYADLEEEYWYYILEGLAIDCGLDTGLSPNPCVETTLFFERLEEDCPRRCNGDDSCIGDCCADGEEERDPGTCGNVECEIFLGEITDESLEELVANSQSQQCDSLFTLPLTTEEFRYWFSDVAQQCGHDEGFTVVENCFDDCLSTPDTCAAMEALVSVGGCANDCEVDAVQPLHDELGCEVSLDLDQILLFPL
jgi:hypothetical protein